MLANVIEGVIAGITVALVLWTIRKTPGLPDDV
jgi:hypothetical protein